MDRIIACINMMIQKTNKNRIADWLKMVANKLVGAHKKHINALNKMMCIKEQFECLCQDVLN